jgi:hypothetical protein
MERLPAEQRRCRIRRWRGYVRSTFYAEGPGGSLLFESEPFRWRRAAAPPDAGPARTAYDALVGLLQAEGWEPEGQGRPWFDTRFVHAGLEPASAGAAVEAHAVTVADCPAPPVVAPRQPRAPLRALTVAAIAAAALGATALVVGAGSSAPSASVGTHSPRLLRTPFSVHTNRQASRPQAQPHRKARTADLSIGAHANGSWLEVRRGSPSGPTLYSGVLLPGQTLHFRAARLWARMGAAGNLDVALDGKPVALQGTYDKLFLPSRRS